jgi:hypothetical protein
MTIAVCLRASIGWITSVACMVKAASKFQRAGLNSRSERNAIAVDAARAACGKPVLKHQGKKVLP